MDNLPQRRWLHHTPPSWVRDATYFITVCCQIRGQDQLCAPATSEQLFIAIRHYHEHQRWYVHLWLLMPDHAHALVSCPHTEDLAKVMTAWKRHTARHAGIDWQKGFFDHRLRTDESTDESFDGKAFYIRQNPVRAGLITDASDWPHIWTPK